MENAGLSDLARWSLAVACGYVNLLTMSPNKMPGLFFVEILDRYKTTREMAAHPVFLCMLVRCSAGPLIGYLGQRFGIIPVITMGCILSSVGVTGCFFAEDISAVIVLLGLVYGFGISLSTSLIPELIRPYFGKDITTAIGITLSGSSIGSFILPPILEWLRDIYGLSGTFLILGAIISNSIPIPLLFKALTQKKRCGRSKAQEFEKFPDEIPKIESGAMKSVSFVKEAMLMEAIFEEGNTVVNVNNVLHNKNIENRNGKQRPVEKSSENDYKESVKLESHFSAEIPPSALAPIASLKVSPKRPTVLQSLSVFLDVTYWMILIIQGMTIIILMMVSTTMVDYARDKGIDRSKGVYFLMGFAFSEVVGRLGLGWITDKRHLTNNSFCVVSLVILGVSCTYMTWIDEFWEMMVGVSVFATLISAIITVFPGIIFEHIEREKQIMALASRYTLYGPLSFTCAPIIGYFRSTLGSYDSMYYILTATSIACGILQSLIPFFARRR